VILDTTSRLTLGETNATNELFFFLVTGIPNQATLEWLIGTVAEKVALYEATG